MSYFFQTMLVCTASACATASVWTNFSPSGTLDWTDESNWSGGVPDSPGAEVVLSGDFKEQNAVIRLGKDITVGSLLAGDTLPDPDTGFAVILAKTGGYSLTFQSDEEGGETFLSVPFSVAQSPWYQECLEIQCPVILGGSSSLTVEAEGTISFSGVDVRGNTCVFTNTNGNRNISIGGYVRGEETGRIVFNAPADIMLGTDTPDFFGTVVVNADSSTFLEGSSMTSAREFIVNCGGSVKIGNSSAKTVNPGQRITSNSVTLCGGMIVHGGQALKDDAEGGVVGDSVDRLVVTNGNSRIQLSTAGGSSGTFVKAGRIERTPGAILSVAAKSLGKAMESDIKGQQFIVENGLEEYGPGGGEGSFYMNVIPWMFCKNEYDGHAPDRPAANTPFGIRGLYDTEMDNVITGAPNRNVCVNSLTLPEDQTVNSLVYGQYNASDIGAGRVLRVSSGSVLMRRDNARIGEVSSPNAGTLDFGSSEGCVLSLSNTDNTSAIGAVIAGESGLTIGTQSGGKLRLTAENTYTGNTYVVSGRIQVGDGTSATSGACLGDGDVTICGGASLVIADGVENAISNMRVLRIESSGNADGMLCLDGSVAETVKSLYLGGLPMPAGVYGAPGSGAEYEDARFFSGTGVLISSVMADPPQRTFIIVR